jgi:hypothetical protein
MENQEVYIFGYWYGPLPEIADLHFLSFVKMNPGVKYHLYLDIDGNVVIPQNLRWILDHEDIQIHEFSLQESLLTAVKMGLLKTFSTALFRRNKIVIAAFRIMRFCLMKLNFSKKRNRSEVMGSEYNNYSIFANALASDLAYRGDIARFVIPIKDNLRNFIYFDLDICFLSPIKRENWPLCSNFIYRWEDYKFGNNAVISISSDEAFQKVLDKINEMGSFRPWFIFQEDMCHESSIDILDCLLFEPISDPLLEKYVGTSDFFKKEISSIKSITSGLLENGYFLNHWHNSWKVQPEDGSPYSNLLHIFRT